MRCGSRDSAAECVARKPLDTSGVAYAAPNVIGRVELKGRDLENIERRKALAANKPPAKFNPIRGLENVKPSAPRSPNISARMEHVTRGPERRAPGHLAMGKTNPARDSAREAKRIAHLPTLAALALIEAAAPGVTGDALDAAIDSVRRKRRTVYGNTWLTTRAVREFATRDGRKAFASVGRSEDGRWHWQVTLPGGLLNSSEPVSATGHSPNEKAAKIAAKRCAEAWTKKS